MGYSKNVLTITIYLTAPYESYKPEAQFNAYWVKKPLEEGEYGLPLSVRFTTFQDQILTQELIDQMVSASLNYAGKYRLCFHVSVLTGVLKIKLMYSTEN